MAPGLCPRPNLCYARAPSPACALLDNHIEFRSWRENCNFEKSKELSRVRKMQSFGVDAEWIPGEERRHRLKMTTMKPSGNHTSVASFAGRHRRSAASVRTASPRRWVGSRGGCALCGVRTVANRRHHPARGGGGMMAPISARAQATQLWYRLTGVRLVRHMSVDHCGRLLGRVSVLCAAHIAAPLFFGSPCRAVCLHRRASHVGDGCRRCAGHQQRVGCGQDCGGGLWEDFGDTSRRSQRGHYI
jgi:hypothetical protein